MRRERVLLAAVAFLLLCGPLWAESEGQSSPAAGGGVCVGVIVLYACYALRKQEIGGVLLYYYIQIYLATFATLVMFALSFDNYRPGSWSSAPHLYPWHLIAVVPGLLIVPVQLVVAERLRLSRDDRLLRWLRAVLWVELAQTLLAGVVDLVCLPQKVLLDILGLVWPSIWLPYFYRSTRVRRVFTTRDWVVPESHGVLGLRETLREPDAPPGGPSDQGAHGGDSGVPGARPQVASERAPRVSVGELLLAEAQLDRSFMVCVVTLVGELGWQVYAHGTGLETTTWVRAVAIAIAVVLLAAYVWFAWSVGRAAVAVGSGRGLYLAWVLVAPFLALVPIPCVSVILAASPLSLKFLLSSQLRARIHERTFEDE